MNFIGLNVSDCVPFDLRTRFNNLLINYCYYYYNYLKKISKLPPLYRYSYHRVLES